MTGQARIFDNKGDHFTVVVTKDPTAVGAGGLDAETFVFTKTGRFAGYALGKTSAGIPSANAPNLTATCEKSAADGGGNLVYGDPMTGIAVILQNNDAGARTFGAQVIVMLTK